MEGEEGDPFGPFIKLCEPTSSQELKLQNCPFARESETFPDAFDSLTSPFSPAQTPSQPPGIVMVSPLERESGEDSSIYISTPRENEEFQTPPEYQNFSFSSQEELQQPPKSKIDGLDHAEIVGVDDCCGDNEVSVDLVKRGENIGFLETEEIDGGDGDSGDDCWGGEEEVKGIDGVEGGLKRFRGFEGELDEPMSEKIRVSGEIWDREMETVCIGEKEITEKADDDELFNFDSEEIDEGTGLHEDTILIDVDSTEEKSEENDGVSENGETEKVVEGISDGTNDCVGETKKVYRGPEGGFGNPGEEGKVGLNGGEKSAMICGGLEVEASEEGVRNYGTDEERKNGEKDLGCRNIEEIEKFKYRVSGDGCHQNWNKGVLRSRRELPLSMTENDNDMGGKKKVGKVDIKNGSWKELLDALAVILGMIDDNSGEMDFVEVAKRRGITFPQPRWR